MTTNAKIKSDIQRLDVGSELVDLYEFDASILGGSRYRFTPQTDDGAAVVFNGLTYYPLPVEVTGMEITGDGTLPRPHLKVANIILTFVGIVNAYKDAVGSKVTRIRTFRKYLDGHAEADANAEFPRDVFYIEQKITQNKYYIEWELVTPIDIGNKKIPRNQVLSTCSHFYRYYKDGAFKYTLATCPYTGAAYFDSEGNPTTKANDKCGKRYSDCELRYPNKYVAKPFKGFPGIGMISRAYT